MLQQDAYGYRLPYPVRYPVELHTPPGFKVDDPATWPRVEGRLEFVDGRLLYMPPCGDTQQDVTADVVYVLKAWARAHSGYVIGTNEAGVLIGGETRGADAAVWRKDSLGNHTGGYRRVPPLLAVEVAGQDEGERELRAKAGWYLQRGVEAVWIVLPESRELLLMTSGQERRYGASARLGELPALPGLTPEVGEFFTQLE